jgi:hypothetical protein
VGHWDVPDLTEALAEAYGLVEQGVISEADFKAYVFTNPYKLYTEANPDFFKGTAVEAKLRANTPRAQPPGRCLCRARVHSGGAAGVSRSMLRACVAAVPCMAPLLPPPCPLWGHTLTKTRTRA